MDYEIETREWLTHKLKGEQRFSNFLVKQIAEAQDYNGMCCLDPFLIYDEIEALEKGISSTTKEANQFKRPPLQGLWKKHFIQPIYIKNNLKKVNVEADPGSYEKILEMSHAKTWLEFLSKQKQKRLTGEWLVFAKHDNKNYYLLIAQHGNDEAIRWCIENCIPEFPFIKNIIHEHSLASNPPIPHG